MFLADLYNNKRLFENMSPIDLAEMLFNGLMQQYPEAVKRYGHEVVGDAVMNYAEDAEDIHSMSDVDIAIQEIMDDLANYRGDRTNELEPDGEPPLQEDLRKWFKEKWVRFGPDGKIRGACARGDESEGKPKCLPQAKAHALGKKGRKYAAAKKRREDPDPERRGPAKNVATKKKSNEGVAEGSMKDLHIDLQDQQWDAIVGYVINGLKKNMDIGRIELNLYKYAGQELFDVDQALEDRGFRDIADLANHIKQHNGKYVPPTDFGLSDLGKGVAEGRFDEPLTGWHIVYRKSGNPVHATPSFETKDQAQKYLMTKMFANHQDYKVVHTAGVGVAEGSLNEMDKSAPQPGRDGKVSHSTYGSRDKQSNTGGKEHTAKAVTAKQATKDALDILKKQGVAEATEMPVSDHNTKPAQDYDIDLFQQLVQNYKPKSRAGELVKHYLIGPGHFLKSDDTIQLIDEIYYEEIENGWQGPSLPEEVSDLRFYRRAMKKSLYQGVAEGSLDDIEDTRQFRNAVALAKSQKAVRQAKDGKDAKYYADGTKVTPAEVARRAAERKAKKQGVAEAAFNPYTSSTSSRNTSPELRSVPIPQDMRHPEWREPTWSFTEIAEKLGVSPKELQVLVLAIGNFPKKSEGLKSSHGSRAYYPRSEIKRWVQSSNIREIIKSRKGVAETQQMCPECSGPAFSDLVLAEKQDACYHKVKSRYKVWPSAYASGALVQCRKKGAANWGKKKTNEAKESPTQDYQKMMNFVQAQRLSGVPPEQQVAVALFKELEKTKAFNKQLDAELKAAGERADIGAEQGELATKELGKHRGELEKEKQKQQASRQQLQALSQQLEQLKTAPNVDAEASQAIEQQIAELEQKMQDRQGTGVSADKITELEQAIAKVQQGETVDADAIKKLEQQFADAETAAKTAKEKVGQVKDYESAIAKLNAEIDALTAEVNKDEKQIADIQGALANTVEPTVQKVEKLEPQVNKLVQKDQIQTKLNTMKTAKAAAADLTAPLPLLQKQNMQQQELPLEQPVTETRFYFSPKATLAETLRTDFAMTQDSEGWYLTATQGPAKLLEAQRAFGIPKVKQVKLKEVRISDYTGRAGTIGDENATSPIGSLPRKGRRPA